MASASPRLVLVSVLATLVFAGYLILFAPWRPHGGESSQRIQADFCDAIPKGSTEETVLKFLANRKERHSGPKAEDHTIRVFLGNTGNTVFFECSTEVRFAFGDDNRLSRCDVSQACDGP